MSDDQNGKKLTADEIREQLGYRRVVRKRREALQPRQVVEDVRTVGNGRMLNDFDNFMSSVRRIRVLHVRIAAQRLVDAAKRVK